MNFSQETISTRTTEGVQWETGETINSETNREKLNSAMMCLVNFGSDPYLVQSYLLFVSPRSHSQLAFGNFRTEIKWKKSDFAARIWLSKISQHLPATAFIANVYLLFRPEIK
ncbi:hypothetical protein M0813_26109 [Anaeramoeba flamelloides]|uniref:Uncharacterized protein n=1 Tax=Anaeramoeba flamelloides TaxID=1746091 RepID=A0ABQ8Y3W3_9EUKA|nr:hypothetical protein M0813_26109 [Anaeramoeba flamelloides]